MADNKKEPEDKKEVKQCTACELPCGKTNQEARDRYNLSLLNAHFVLDKVSRERAN